MFVGGRGGEEQVSQFSNGFLSYYNESLRNVIRALFFMFLCDSSLTFLKYVLVPTGNIHTLLFMYHPSALMPL